MPFNSTPLSRILTNIIDLYNYSQIQPKRVGRRTGRKIKEIERREDGNFPHLFGYALKGRHGGKQN